MIQLSAFLLLAAVSAQSPSPASQSAVEAAIARVGPSLVRIHVVMVDHSAGREIKREASGSGTIISPDGFVLMNHHVAGRTRSITCTLANREEVPAVLVGTDPLSDLAVLKLQPSSPTKYPAAGFGDSSKLRVGDPVLALGSPLALSQSVTMGIVSNTEMIMPGMFWPFNRMTLDGEDVGSIVRWIGHDAPIFGGNSGGPLVNLAGEVVGVNEISLGLAGAIPADLAQEVSTALIREGKVRRSWIGLDVQPRLKSDHSPAGALVGSTIDGSPAATAGFIPGDLLVRLDGRGVNVQFAEEVPLFNQQVMVDVVAVVRTLRSTHAGERAVEAVAKPVQCQKRHDAGEREIRVTAEPETHPSRQHRECPQSGQVIRSHCRRQAFREPDQQTFFEAGQDAGVHSVHAERCRERDRRVAERSLDLELERLPVVGVFHLEAADRQADRRTERAARRHDPS